jgi:hypothetical protein
MINKNTLYFIHNEVIKNTNFDKLAIDDAHLMHLADLVISGNITLKDRQRGHDEFIGDSSIIEEIATFDGLVISRPTKKNQDKQASHEFIQSQIKQYTDNQKNVADPIIDRIALELRGLYPKLTREQSVDWALEFINTDYRCEDIFKRMDGLFLPVKVENKFDKYFNS